MTDHGSPLHAAMNDVAAALVGADGLPLDDGRVTDLLSKLARAAREEGLTSEQVVLAFRAAWAREVERVAGGFERMATEENRHRAIDVMVDQRLAALISGALGS